MDYMELKKVQCNALMQRPTTPENLSILGALYPEKFAFFLPTMELHVLPRKWCETESCVDNAGGASFEAAPSADDKSAGYELLNRWCGYIESFVAAVVKKGENVVFFAGRTLEDAVYLFYTRSFELSLVYATVKDFANIQDAYEAKIREAKAEQEVDIVHIVLAECPEFDKLQFAAKGEFKKKASYCYNSADFYVAKDFYSLLKKCKEGHENIVTD